MSKNVLVCKQGVFCTPEGENDTVGVQMKGILHTNVSDDPRCKGSGEGFREALHFALKEPAAGVPL